MLSFSFNHIAISVKDVAISIAFYKKVLDLVEIENTASNSTTRWLALGDNKELHLIPRPNSIIKITKEVHFALSTSEFDNVINHLKSLNITFFDWDGATNQIFVRKDGIRQIYFQDPDGYWIEINDAR